MVVCCCVCVRTFRESVPSLYAAVQSLHAAVQSLHAVVQSLHAVVYVRVPARAPPTCSQELAELRAETASLSLQSEVLLRAAGDRRLALLSDALRTTAAK